MSDATIIEPRVPRGFRDYLPSQMNARLRLIEAIRKVYELYGFQPLDTPAQEFRETLEGYGEEGSKQIFRFRNPEEEDVALRFDLTAPLARVVAGHPDLPLPFRRYQVAAVWRADKPDAGRFREFLQFDMDSVGTSSPAADTEILCCVYDTLRALGLERFQVRFSSRKVLNVLLDFAGIPRGAAHGVFRVLDKLEKIGLQAVKEELTAGRTDASGDRIRGLGLERSQVERVERFLSLPGGSRREALRQAAGLLSSVPAAEEALGGLEQIIAGLERLAIPERQVRVDLSIARGLDYYTGTVFEAFLEDASDYGAVFGGGRYDTLVRRFLGRDLPAVGASLGVDRLLAALQTLGLMESRPATARVLVTVMDGSRMGAYEVLARELREAGFNTEMYLGQEGGLGKQLQYANRLGIPVAVIMGSDEFERGQATVKNLRLGALLQEGKKPAAAREREEWLRLSRSVQVTVPRGELIAQIRAMLADPSASGGRGTAAVPSTGATP
ncbi:MAG: histidine--tRNA ligase [Bacteroidota bacterium]